MFAKFLLLIERAVVALEKLATASTPDVSATPEAPAKQTRTRKQPDAAPTPPATADDDFLNEPPAAEPEVTYERADVKAALQEYGKKHGMDKAQALFIKVSGVKALSDLPVEKFAEVIAAIKK